MDKGAPAGAVSYNFLPGVRIDAKALQGNLQCVFVSLALTSVRACTSFQLSIKKSILGRCSFGMRRTYPAHLSCEPRALRVWPIISALWRTSVSETLSCHVKNKQTTTTKQQQQQTNRFLSHLMWNEFSGLAWRLYTVKVSQAYSKEGRGNARYTLSLVCRLISVRSHTLAWSLPKAGLARALLWVTSSSMVAGLDRVLLRTNLSATVSFWPPTVLLGSV